MAITPVVLDLHLPQQAAVSLGVRAPDGVGLSIGAIAVNESSKEYTGAVSVVPSASTQTLDTAGYYLRENITVEPIPSNYGLVTWDGSVLTVS